MLGPLIMGGSTVAGALLGNKGQKRGQPQQNFSPTQSLHWNSQNNLNRFDVGVNAIPIAAQMQNMRRYQANPGDPGYSGALAAQQAANPNMPLEYLGIEPRNAAQNAAFSQYDDPLGSLAQYMQPSEKELQARLKGVNRVYDDYTKRVTEQNALLNSRIDPTRDPQMQQQMERIEKNRADNIGDVEGMMERIAFDRANAYRNQSLEQMLQSGNLQHEYAQQLANNANAYNQTVNNPGYGQSHAINQLYAPLMGGGGIGERPGQVNGLGQLGGFMMRMPQMFGQYNSMYGAGNNQGTPWNFLNPYGNTTGQHFGGY